MARVVLENVCKSFGDHPIVKNAQLDIPDKEGVAKGKALFTKHCAACHTLFGEGGKVGPDLTTADRRNRMFMLTHIVDPSGYIRPEYVAFKVDTLDGRALTGLVTDPTGESVTLLNVVDNKQQKTVVAKKDIDTITGMAMIDSRASGAWIASSAVKLMTKKEMMRPMPITCSAKKRRTASTSDVQRWINSPVCIRSW